MMSVNASSPGLSHDEPVTGKLRPTNVRWHMVGLLTVIAALTYLDRVNLSIAGKYIQDEFSFSTETMGLIFSAFVWGYALFQIVGGWVGDRYGPRGILTLAIAWWSVFTAATGIAARLPLAGWLGIAWSFAIVRFLVGAGEAATFPNANKIVAVWMGTMQRSIGISLPIAGIGAGGALTPILITYIMQRWGWRMSFYFCSLLGIVMAVVWYLYATNRPEDHPRLNAAERALISERQTTGRVESQPGGLPTSRARWRKMLSSRSVWAMSLSSACVGYSIYIYHTWFFIYLVRGRGLTVTQGGLWGTAPYLAIALLAPLGGWFSDRAVRKFGRRRGRQSAMWLGLASSVMLLLTGSHTANVPLAILLLAGAAGSNLFSTATLFATCSDLTTKFTGTLSGLINMCASFGGALSPIITARIATHLGWNRVFDIAALVTFAAGILWVFVDADKRIDE